MADRGVFHTCRAMKATAMIRKRRKGRTGMLSRRRRVVLTRLKTQTWKMSSHDVVRRVQAETANDPEARWEIPRSP
jgi:hypothetical protein